MFGESTMRPGIPRLLLPAVAVLLSTLASTIVLGQEPTAAPTGSWFYDIETPLRLSGQHGSALCRMAWRALSSGQVGSRKANPTGTPRAVFVSWSDGVESAHVVHGVGTGPVDALRAALATVPAADFPHDTLHWLKVDVVQTVVTIPRLAEKKLPNGRREVVRIPGFYARESVLPMPSVIGIAFSHSSGLAFLPEELMGRSMLGPKNRFSGTSYATRLTEEKRFEDMVRWGRMVALPLPQKISFFETQAWFFDGSECVPLYRGHRLYDNPTRKQLRAIAIQAATRLAGMVDAEGHVVAPVPEWLGETDGSLRPFDCALVILALSQAAHLAEDPAPLVAAAERLAKPLIARLHRFGKGKKMACLIEEDENQDTGGTWQVVRLGTNALSALALCGLATHGDAKRHDVPLAGLTRYLLMQRQADGSFAGQRRWPEGTLIGGEDRTAGSIAVCAMVALYEKTNEQLFWSVASKAFQVMLPKVEKTPMGQLTNDEWFLRAAAVCSTYGWEPRSVVQAQRYALGVVTQQDHHPASPDMFGSVKRLPSATASASQTGLIAVAARLTWDGGRKSAAKEMLAESRASLIAQLQGRMTGVESMYLPEPQRYPGLFRDHVRGHGFDLQSQYVQISSLCELFKAMKRMKLESLQSDSLLASKRLDTELQAARASLERYPLLLGDFDGTLQRHVVVLPGRTAEPRSGEPVVVPARDWDAPLPGAGGTRQRTIPVVRPVQPRR